MILIFDLDDTLYVERTYVQSGFRAVAAWGERRFGWPAEQSYGSMLETLDREGRGAVFDEWLAAHGRRSATLVAEAVRTYRQHEPDIQLAPEAAELLRRYRRWPLYLVTDGHKLVQLRKVQALAIEPLFRKVFITHRYGIANAKPSTLCFERIRSRERCDWRDMVYIGDNPAKDFVNLRPLGMRTVRVLTGEHKNRPASESQEAEFRIASLTDLPPLIELFQADKLG
ncbi:HAD family hydrolase [Sphingomonas sp.]|uniref:HAD family hydrolase n=1 Tax=Sphingomonas sp. TaxID=28214 RepID=UPI002E12B26B